MEHTPTPAPSPAAGTLYIVATPIGNLEDITLRALRILKEVAYIAAEDTRHTKKLLNHFDIHTNLISYYREQENQRADQIVDFLLDGQDVAIVTDAGTPCISDPGAVVVQKARQKRITIVPIPGPSALTAALSCAGMSDKSFMFHGFAPAKKGQRRQLFHTLIHADYYAVFYESPHRIEGFLQDAYEILGERRIFMGRELTKNFEELLQTTLSELIEITSSKKNRGEYVLILSPAQSTPSQEMDIDELILWYRDNSSLSLKDSCKTLAADLGISRSKIYQRALQIWQDTDNH
jgi:16S rRNA (cytidine1402-2'-O)-methyltransferase